MTATPCNWSSARKFPAAPWNSSGAGRGTSAWLDACELQVDRGDGKSYVPLCVDTTPNYTDTQAFPTAKTIWSYRAIYRVDDRQVGVWSMTVNVTVGG